MTTVILAALALALVWPVPALLAGSAWPLRRPAIALALWQAIGLGTGLAAIGAAVHYGLTGAGPRWASATALAAGVGLASYLLGVAAVVTFRTLVRRRRHRQLLDLVGRPLSAAAHNDGPGGDAIPGGRVLDSATAMAYCVPGLRPRMVVTSTALAGLSPAALDAVVAHERSHLRQRHDLVVLPFVAWQAAVGFLPGARTARASVALLIEALADDCARAQVGDQPLDDALCRVALVDSSEPMADLGVVVRRARLRLAAR